MYVLRIGGENVAYLLCAGQHECRLVQGVEGPGVSLLPLGGMVANISTTVMKQVKTILPLRLILICFHYLHFDFIQRFYLIVTVPHLIFVFCLPNPTLPYPT